MKSLHRGYRNATYNHRRIVRCGIADLLPAVKGEQVTVDNSLKQRT